MDVPYSVSSVCKEKLGQSWNLMTSRRGFSDRPMLLWSEYKPYNQVQWRSKIIGHYILHLLFCWESDGQAAAESFLILMLKEKKGEEYFVSFLSWSVWNDFSIFLQNS